MVFVDSGGSNGISARAWKHGIQARLSNRYGLTVIVAHYPSGCSKFNPIEHRLFSEISKNWSGVPLEIVEATLHCIRTTTTKTGLRVNAQLISREFRTGIKIGDSQMAQLALTQQAPLPRLNSAIVPISPPQSRKSFLRLPLRAGIRALARFRSSSLC